MSQALPVLLGWLPVEASAALTTIRPSADVTDGGWLNEAASAVSLYASVDDDPTNDAQYIESPLTYGTDVCEVQLADPGATPPAGDVILYIRHRAV